MCEICKNDGDRPCCADGYCVTDTPLGICMCCGAEMFQNERGTWYHHSQQDIPEEERWMIHYSTEDFK